MTKAELVTFLRQRRLAVVSTVSGAGAPEAALVGIAFTDDLEIVFDTTRNTRKFANLSVNPRVAMVIGWDDETTVQIEGEAGVPPDEELARYKRAYFEVWPDGRERECWPDIAYVVVAPAWARYSSFSGAEPVITEFRLRENQ